MKWYAVVVSRCGRHSMSTPQNCLADAENFARLLLVNKERVGRVIVVSDENINESIMQKLMEITG